MHLPRFAALMLAGLSIVAASCSANPLEELTEVERSYVIPNSSGWGEGDPCGDGGDCAGPITPDFMRQLCWVEIDPTSWSVSDVVGEPFGNGFFEIAKTLKGPPDDVVLGEVGNERAEGMNKASIAGHRLLLGTECATNAAAEVLIYHVIAVDQAGRIAGIGFGSELFTTIPLAKGAAEAGAATGEQYILSVLSR